MTPGFLRSVWIQIGSGSGRRCWATVVPYPASRARCSATDTAPTLMPRLAATSRWLRPTAHLSLRISRILRMDSRSVSILAPLEGG